MLDDLYARHEKVALMFSGGRDSLACLHLTQPYWEQTTVVWVNPQANFPEIESVMQAVREIVPHFLEVTTDQPASIEQFGYPVDLLPVDWTAMGQVSTKPKTIMLRSYLDCCSENKSLPADRAARDAGCTAIIRGSRSDEMHHSVVKSGFVHEGVEYCHPLQTWTFGDVLNFLRERGVDITPRLMLSESSLDCWNCTAFLPDRRERRVYIKERHPEVYAHLVPLLKEVRNAALRPMADLESILEV